MDLKTVKRLVGDRVCLVGNIDCSYLLTNGTPEEVERAVRQAIEDAAGVEDLFFRVQIAFTALSSQRIW